MSVYVNLPNGEHAQRVVMAGAETGQGDVPVSSNGILPVEIQSRLASTIQTHSGVLVGASGSNIQTSWMDCEGFMEIALTVFNDASTSSRAHIYWSHDNTTIHGSDFDVLPTNTLKERVVNVPIKARYCKVVIFNGDATPHTMSAWVYLKA